ncbi:hypothetical protein BCF59_0504 [Mycoplasmopsis mustelae]|uniref:Uncharacterized protein n=1 Tax=Mycoplasmopsis mustelae TaxID=171289 RepID=A0A4R7UD77_9BACT|nr:hypothetical protein [Mycoplasmopsis mustelae]TDV23515.1 hypothetical protein BCF59_0504 [Mycoplasmopsis mustelae]
MFKWLQLIPNFWKKILLALCIILFLLAFSLLVAGLVNDGVNEFAKVFYFYKEVPVPDDRWKEFLKYAQEQKLAPEHIEKLREIFGDTFTITQEQQNVVGYGFFICTMFLIALFSFSIATSLIFINIQATKHAGIILFRERLINEHEYNTFLAILEAAQQRLDKKERIGISLDEINKQIEKLEQNESE